MIAKNGQSCCFSYFFEPLENVVEVRPAFQDQLLSCDPGSVTNPMLQHPNLQNEAHSIYLLRLLQESSK